MADRCAHCRFYQVQPQEGAQDRLTCHRYPPAVGAGGWPQWPQVNPWDWCGEWQAWKASTAPQAGSLPEPAPDPEPKPKGAKARAPKA